jgi:hypothetical protein
LLASNILKESHSLVFLHILEDSSLNHHFGFLVALNLTFLLEFDQLSTLGVCLESSSDGKHAVIIFLNKESRSGQHEKAGLISGVQFKSLDALVLHVAELSSEHIALSLS